MNGRWKEEDGPLGCPTADKMEVARHFFNTQPFSSQKRRDHKISLSESEASSYFDQMAMQHVDRMTTWLASNTLEQTVKFDVPVKFGYATPETWVDHFLLEHPRIAYWVAKITGRMVNWSEKEEVKRATDTRIVKLHALVPRLEIPKGARQGFPVVYTTTQEDR